METVTFIPDPSVLGAFAAAAVLLTLTPGPDMTLFLGKAATSGRAAGLAAFFGAVTGLFVHCAFAAIGVSALLRASPTAFFVLKIVGALYLLWLAIQVVRHGSAFSLEKTADGAEPLLPLFLSGLGINLLNPKIVLFFVTFLPQFVAASDPHAAGKLLFLGLFFIAMAVPICLAMIFAVDRIAGHLKRSPWMLKALDWLFAGVMGAFAVRLLVARPD